MVMKKSGTDVNKFASHSDTSVSRNIIFQYVTFHMLHMSKSNAETFAKFYVKKKTTYKKRCRVVSTCVLESLMLNIFIVIAALYICTSPTYP